MRMSNIYSVPLTSGLKTHKKFYLRPNQIGSIRASLVKVNILLEGFVDFFKVVMFGGNGKMTTASLRAVAEA